MSCDTLPRVSDIHREMLNAALDQLAKAQERIASLEKKLAAARAEIRRYIAMKMGGRDE